MRALDDGDVLLLLRAGDSPSTVARIGGRDLEEVEALAPRARAAGRLRALADREALGELRRRLRGELEEEEIRPEPSPEEKAIERAAKARPRSISEPRAREEAPALRAEIKQLRQRLAQAEGLAAHQAAQRDEANSTAFMEGLGRAKAHRERDEAKAEVEQLHLNLRGLQKDYDGLRASLESEAERARALEVERDAAREEVGQLRAALADVSSLRDAEQRADTDREGRFRVEACKAHERADASDDEVKRLTSENEQLRGLLSDQRKLREQTEERLRVEKQQAAKAEARADAAEAEVRRLVGELRGLKDLAVAMREFGGTRAIRDLTDDDYRTSGEVGLRPQDLAALTPERASRFIEGARRRQADAAQIQSILAAVARIEAALAEGIKTQPSKLAAAVAEESAEEVAQLRAELAARTKERDASRAAMADLLRERQTSTCSTKGCGAPSKVKGVCMRCYKREWSARKAASR